MQKGKFGRVVRSWKQDITTGNARLQEYATGLTVDSESIPNGDITLKGVYCKTEKEGIHGKNT